MNLTNRCPREWSALGSKKHTGDWRKRHGRQRAVESFDAAKHGMHRHLKDRTAITADRYEMATMGP